MWVVDVVAEVGRNLTSLSHGTSSSCVRQQMEWQIYMKISEISFILHRKHLENCMSEGW